ncbi:MAG: UDP-3-O-(3-hydroxymyristoyl)glucosamine N-acyltransferase [Akkermansiaceae bacterium]
MLSFADLVALVGAGGSEDSDASFDGVNSLDRAGSSEISFLGNPKYEPLLRETQAGAVLVPAGDWEAPEGCQLIEVENPSASFSRVINHFQQSRPVAKPGVAAGALVDSSASVHPTASIAPGAVVGSKVKVGAGTVISSGVVLSAGVEVGADCRLYPNVTVREECLLGDRVIVQPNAVIGSDGFGFELVDGVHEKVPQVGIVVVEDDVEIGSNTCIDRARFGKTLIGKGTKIDNLVQVAHNVEIGEHCLLVSQSGIAGSSVLGKYVTVAAQAGVGGHVEIGDHVVLVARAGAMKNHPKPGAYMGFPARPMALEQKKMAALARLPKLLEEVRSFKKALENSSNE